MRLIRQEISEQADSHTSSRKLIGLHSEWRRIAPDPRAAHAMLYQTIALGQNARVRSELEGHHCPGELVANFETLRDKIAEVFAEFRAYHARIRKPGGFRPPVPASEGVFDTPDGKAQFITTPGLEEDRVLSDETILTLGSMHGHDEYDTTIYGLDDRYRGVFGRRVIPFLNPEDMSSHALEPGDLDDVTAIDLEPDADDVIRKVRGPPAVPYNLPKGSAGAYFPECQALFALGAHDSRSGIPSFKSIGARASRSREKEGS